MKSVDVVTFGEAMVMFAADEIGPLQHVNHFTKYLAGAETNVAIGLARLGHTVGWVSKVGDDPLGLYIMEALGKEGIDTSHIRIHRDCSTGFMLKSKTVEGDPHLQYFRKNSAASTMSSDDFSLDFFAAARHLHMTGIPLALSGSMREFAQLALSTMKSAGKTVSFDPNLRPQLWKNKDEMIRVINHTAVQASWVLPGIAEGELLTGYNSPADIASFYMDKGVQLVVVKLGAKGAYYRSEAGEGYVSGFTVTKVVDTVGAGDGFAVGLISGLVDRLSIDQAVRRANAIGGIVITYPGDSDGLPTKAKLDAFMQEGS